MHFLRYALAVAALFALAATGCGGKALHRVDDAALADLRLEEKTQIVLAEEARSRALDDVHQAVADVEVARRDVAVSRADLDQQAAEVKKAEAELKLVSSRNEKAAIEASRERVDLARERFAVAEARLSAHRERLALLEHKVELARAQHRWFDARYELERARLAERKGRTPNRDRVLRAYEEQADLAQHDVVESRLGASKHEDALEKAERVYREREEAFERHIDTGE